MQRNDTEERIEQRKRRRKEAEEEKALAEAELAKARAHLELAAFRATPRSPAEPVASADRPRQPEEQ